MPNQSSFQRVITFMVIGIGLIAVGVAAMTLLALRQSRATTNITTLPVAVDYPAPAFTLNNLEGRPSSLKDYPGQVVLVNMWATWCPPCREEMPTLEAFYEDHAKDGFVIIGLNDGDSLLDVRDFLAEYQLTFPIWLDPQYSSETLFKTSNLPSSYVIDRKGQVRLQWVGAINRELLDKYVLPIILQ
jgi:thiol-disulfide isomerase/thioredoxin